MRCVPNMTFEAGCVVNTSSLSAGTYGHDSQDRWLESGAALHTRRWRSHVRARRASLFPRLGGSEQRLTLLDSVAATKTQSKSESLSLGQKFPCYELDRTATQAGCKCSPIHRALEFPRGARGECLPRTTRCWRRLASLAILELLWEHCAGY